MKNSNGYGSVIKLKGNRRRPYVARKTVGWDGDVQIVKAVGYYATRKEAMMALAEYNHAPYDIDARKITMAEVYELWEKRMTSSGHLAAVTMKGMRSAFRGSEALHGVAYSEIRAHMMQGVIDAASAGSKGQIKTFFHNLDKFAIENEMIDKMYSALTRAPYESTKEKKPFADAEVSRLWSNADMPWVDTILILLYSGWRITELLTMASANVNVDTLGVMAQTMRGGVKTRAGKDRIVPIHRAILPLVTQRRKGGGSYLIEKGGTNVEYKTYVRTFQKIMKSLGMEHTVHETRHTFCSWLNSAGANGVCIDLLMGHKSSNTGERVYTHKTLDELRATIGLIESEQTPKARFISNT